MHVLGTCYCSESSPLRSVPTPNPIFHYSLRPTPLKTLPPTCTVTYRYIQTPAHDTYRFKVFCTASVVRYSLPARKLVERVIVGWQLNFNINTNILIIDFDSPLFANTYHEEEGGGGGNKVGGKKTPTLKPFLIQEAKHDMTIPARVFA